MKIDLSNKYFYTVSILAREVYGDCIELDTNAWTIVRFDVPKIEEMYIDPIEPNKIFKYSKYEFSIVKPKLIVKRKFKLEEGEYYWVISKECNKEKLRIALYAEGTFWLAGTLNLKVDEFEVICKCQKPE